jgi:autotransporter-associated beta strand protein
VTVGATGTFDGVIQNGATANIALSVSAHLLTLTNANTYTGATTVSAGILLVNGSIVSNVTVNSGATLGGTGITAATTVTIGNGGHLAPGASPGVLGNGNVTFQAGSAFDVQITSAAANKFDQDNVTGTVNIVTTNGGVALNISKFGNLSLNNGDQLVIIKNDGNGATGDAVQGTFKGLPEGFNLGSNFLGSGLTAKITYKGGDGNDVSIKLSPGSLFPWHNNAKPLDVTGSLDVPPDGHIVAGDAIAVINYLNAFGPGPVPANAVLGLPFGFLDATGGTPRP